VLRRPVEIATKTGPTTPITTYSRSRKRSFEQAKKCSKFASFTKLIASIEDPAVIQKILAHPDKKETPTGTGMLPETRALAVTADLTQG
jgi:hypothetical protein